MQRVDHLDLLRRPIAALLALDQGVEIGLSELRYPTHLRIRRARGGTNDAPRIVGRNEILVGIGLVGLDRLAVRPRHLLGDDGEGIGHEHAHGAVAHPLLLTLNFLGLLAAFVELFGRNRGHA